MSDTNNENKKNAPKKSNKKRIIIIGAAALFVVAAVLLVFFFRDRPPQDDEDNASETEREYDPNAGKDIVAVIDGVPISEAEYVFYFISQIAAFESAGGGDQIWTMTMPDGQTTEDYAKQETLKGIRQVKEHARRAAELNLSLSRSKITETEELAAYYEEVLISEGIRLTFGLTADIMTMCLMDAAYSQALFDYYTDDIGISTPEQEAELARRIEEETEYWEDKAREDEGEAFTPFTPEERREISDRVTERYATELKLEEYRKISGNWTDGIEIDTMYEVLDRITVYSIKIADVRA